MKISDSYVPPAIKELYFSRKGAEYLIINPHGPNWFSTNKFGLFLAGNCDGTTSLGKMKEALKRTGLKVDYRSIDDFFSHLHEICFFTEGVSERLAPLDFVFLNLTSSCNLKCVYCYYNSANTSRTPELSCAGWEKILRQIKEINPGAGICISGGEPTMRKDFFRILDMLQRLKLNVRLLTNGTNFDDAAIKRIQKYSSLRNIQVSLDSLVVKENLTTRGVIPSKITDVIKKMCEKKLPVTVACTVTKANINSLQGIIDFCCELNIRVRFIPYFPAYGRALENIRAFQLKKERIIESFAGLKFPDDPAIRPLKGYKRLTRRVICGLGKGTLLSIAPDGLVYPCNHLYEKRFLLGDAKADSMSDVLENAGKICKPVPVEEMSGCAACGLRYICGGTCRANSYFETGRLDVKSSDCGFNKEAVLRTLWQQCEDSDPGRN